MHRFRTYTTRSCILDHEDFDPDAKYGPSWIYNKLRKTAGNLARHRDARIAQLGSFVARITAGESITVDSQLARELTTVRTDRRDDVIKMKTFTRGFINWGRREDSTLPAVQQIQHLKDRLFGYRSCEIAELALWERALNPDRIPEETDALLKIARAVPSTGRGRTTWWLVPKIVAAIATPEAAEQFLESLPTALRLFEVQRGELASKWHEAKDRVGRDRRGVYRTLQLGTRRRITRVYSLEEIVPPIAPWDVTERLRVLLDLARRDLIPTEQVLEQLQRAREIYPDDETLPQLGA